MTIYLEYVLVNNFIIDFLLLKTTFLITGKSKKLKRLIATCILASVVALVFPLINLHQVLISLLKICLGIVMLLLSNTYSSNREMLINLFIFLTLTFVLGGAIFFIYSLIGVSGGSEFLVATIIIPCYVVVRIIKSVITYIYRRKNIEQVIYQTEIFVNGKRFFARGFLDTGNNVYYKNSPVIICQKKFIESAFNSIEFYKNLRRIEITTANGKTTNYCILLDSFKILIEGRENIFNNVFLMIAQINIDGADIIIHPDLVKKGGIDNEKPIVKNKRVS